MEAQKNLLIVDDEPEILYFLRTMFEEGSYEVAIAENGMQALAILERQDIDVLISDIRIPGMDGIKLMKKAQQHNADIQSILISGHPDVDIAVLAMKEGALDFLLKPLDFDCLKRSVSQAIKKKGKARPDVEQRDLPFSCWI